MDHGSQYPHYFTQELINKIEHTNKSSISKEKQDEIIANVGFFIPMLHDIAVAADTYLYDLQPMRVAYMLTLSNQFGAFCYTSDAAAAKEKFDFFGVSLGTICIIYDNFTHILSSPSSFLDVGSPHLEDSDREFLSLTKIADREIPFTIPLCPIRAEFAIILTAQAVKFIAYHELTHLYRGHLDYRRKHLDSHHSFLCEGEADNGERLPDDYMVRHYLEIDADRGALYLLITDIFNSIYTLDPDPHTGALSVEAQAAYGNPLLATRTLVYSLYAMFKFTDWNQWQEDDLGGTTHPREMVRARYMINKSLSIIKTIEGVEIDVDQVTDMVIHAACLADQDIARLEGMEADFNVLQKALLSNSAEKHIDQINSIHWKLQPMLQPFFRGTKLPD